MDAHELKESRVECRPVEEPAIPPEWLAEFEAAARRPLRTRVRYAFISTYKPVLDDASYRSHAPVAQLDRASGFEPEGRGFNSLRAH